MNGSNSSRSPCFKRTDERIDRRLLLERAPILFSAEVPLYESEMDDNGISSCTVKVAFSATYSAVRDVPL